MLEVDAIVELEGHERPVLDAWRKAKGGGSVSLVVTRNRARKPGATTLVRSNLPTCQTAAR